MLNVLLTLDTQRTLAFSFPTKLAQCLKTTIFKIGKPNYRFLKTILYYHYKRSFSGSKLRQNRGDLCQLL